MFNRGSPSRGKFLGPPPLLRELEVSKYLDDLLGAHEKYLSSIVEKSLLGERSQNLHRDLCTLFDLILRFRSHADRLYEGINELQSRNTDSSRSKSQFQRQSSDKSGSWLGEGRKALQDVQGKFFGIWDRI